MKLSSKTKIGLAILFFIGVMGFNWAYFGKTTEGASNKKEASSDPFKVLWVFALIIVSPFLIFAIFAFFLPYIRAYRDRQSQNQNQNQNQETQPLLPKS